MYNYPGIQIRYVYCWVLGGHLNTIHKCSNQEFEMFILYLWTKFSRCLYGLNRRMCASLNNVIWTSGVTTVNSGQQSLMIKSTIGCFMLSFVHLYFSCDAELYIYKYQVLEILKIHHFLYPVICVSRSFSKYMHVYKCIKVSLILCEILKAYSLQTFFFKY